MCEDGCKDPTLCHCQGEEHAEPIFEDEERVFAYDENVWTLIFSWGGWWLTVLQGKYRFPRVSVTECNDVSWYGHPN
jgi:hypothetical protein